MVKVLLTLLAVLLALPNFIEKNINETPVYNRKEKFSPSLATINSVDKLERYADNLAIQKSISTQSLDYCLLVENIISQRFYHGFSHYTLSENWMAALIQKIPGTGTASKVHPDDILKNENAACSQQALVMMEILRRKRINYRKIGFPHHFAMEANIHGTWYYLDPNMEPTISPYSRRHQSWSGKGDKLKKYYNPAIYTDMDYQFGENKYATIGAVNEVPASRLKMFQSVTSVLSRILWAFPLLILYWKRDKVKKPQSVPYMEQRDLRPLFG